MFGGENCFLWKVGCRSVSIASMAFPIGWESDSENWRL